MSDGRWDYIVVGGGSSGCIVAARLAESGRSTLLIEAGQRAEENPETLRADGYKEAFINDRLMHERFTVPQRACDGRRLFAGTGRGIGGSGAINAMVYTRGAKEDFDAWGEGWRWDDVAPDFEALEKKLRPNRRQETDFTRRCIEAAKACGMREKADLNDGDLRGVLGHEWMNYEGADRRSSYAAFIKGQKLDRLTVATNATATSIEVDASKRARAVHYVTEDGTKLRAEAASEIVLACGALATPTLLLRSGIGPAGELRNAGLDVVADVPVGRNLHDHPNVTLFFLARTDIDCEYPQLYGFDRMKAGAGPSDTCFVFYPARSSFREGLMRMLPAITLSEDAYHAGRAVRWIRGAVSAAFQPEITRRFVRRMYGVVVILGKPKSRGTLRIGASSSGFDVRIDPQYLSDPSDLDVMVDGVRRARALVHAAPLAQLGNRELIPDPTNRAATSNKDDRPGIERFLRQNLMTTYHFAGTCRMGDDASSAVDRQLRVRGVQGLRVADASIIPETPVSAMNAPSMMIAMRASRFLLAH